MPEQQINTRSLEITLTTDDIIILRENKSLDDISGVELAEENFSAVKELCKDRKFPILCKEFGKRSISKDERYFYKIASGEVALCVAFVVKSKLEQLIGSFFVGLNKLEVPVKLFKDEVNAYKWLREQRENHYLKLS